LKQAILEGLMVKHAVACLIALSAGVFLTNAAMATHHTKMEAASAPSAEAGPPPGLALGWPTNGRLATEKDLAGKKICWNDGKWAVFGADGRYSNERTNHGHWVVSEPGTVTFGNDRSIQYLILPDGSFYKHWYHGHKSITGHSERWGKVCT
jgi:hypothetical protein